MEINFEKATRLDAVIELHKNIFESCDSGNRN